LCLETVLDKDFPIFSSHTGFLLPASQKLRRQKQDSYAGNQFFYPLKVEEIKNPRSKGGVFTIFV
jgi:hypothetical protein